MTGPKKKRPQKSAWSIFFKTFLTGRFFSQKLQSFTFVPLWYPDLISKKGDKK